MIRVSPDDYHKADVSGGAAYEVALPNAAADAPLRNEKHETTFGGYVRLSLLGLGFPGGLPPAKAAELQELLGTS